MNNMQPLYIPRHLSGTYSQASPSPGPILRRHSMRIQQQQNTSQASHIPYTPVLPRKMCTQYIQYTPQMSHAPYMPCPQYPPQMIQPAYVQYTPHTPLLPPKPYAPNLSRRHSIASYSTPSIPVNVPKPPVSSRTVSNTSKIIHDPPRNLSIRLCISESEFVQRLRSHIIPKDRLLEYGFPIESPGLQGCAEFRKPMFGPANEIPTQTNYEVKKNGGFKKIRTPFEINFDRIEGAGQIFAQRQCTRCQRAFHVARTGEYLNQESCSYHPDKFEYSTKKYSCCGRLHNSEGCSNIAAHVWSGSVVGPNGPCNDFVQTLPNLSGKSTPKVFALDCEMSYTGQGLDVTKLSVVDYQGEVAYEHYVRPNCKIIDYNSRYSGITENDFLPNSGKSIKSLAEVHHDLLQLFDSDTILIGHGLENDLRALRLVHTTIVDTSIVFPHPKGHPYKKGLKTLTADFLNRKIQSGDEGHSCLEDAQASLELMHFKTLEKREK